MTRIELKMLTLSEVAKTFGVSVETVWSWTFDGCPSRNVSGSPQFWLKEIIEWKRTVTK